MGGEDGPGLSRMYPCEVVSSGCCSVACSFPSLTREARRWSAVEGQQSAPGVRQTVLTIGTQGVRRSNCPEALDGDEILRVSEVGGMQYLYFHIISYYNLS